MITQQNRCKKCSQRLVHPEESPQRSRDHLIRVYHEEVLVRCRCGLWWPMPDALRTVLVAILAPSYVMLDTEQEI